jgi:hypothetical protein
MQHYADLQGTVKEKGANLAVRALVFELQTIYGLQPCVNVKASTFEVTFHTPGTPFM